MKCFRQTNWTLKYLVLKQGRCRNKENISPDSVVKHVDFIMIYNYFPDYGVADIGPMDRAIKKKTAF